MTPTTEQLKDLLANATAGEWRVEQNTTLIWGACNQDDTSSRGMGYPIAEARITPISLSSWARGPDEDAGEANATLIALAPTLAAEVVRLREALADVVRYIPDSVVECRGDKCRELWCASCYGFDAAEGYMETVDAHRNAARQALDANSEK